MAQALVPYSCCAHSVVTIEDFNGAGKPAASHVMKQSFHQAFRALKLAHAETPIVFDEDLTLELLWRKSVRKQKIRFLIERLRPFSLS